MGFWTAWVSHQPLVVVKTRGKECGSSSKTWLFRLTNKSPQSRGCLYSCTHPETNVSPEKCWLEDHFPREMIPFRKWVLILQEMKRKTTPLKFNIALEKSCFEDYFPFKMRHYFKGTCQTSLVYTVYRIYSILGILGAVSYHRGHDMSNFGGGFPSSECSHNMAGDGQVPHPKDASMLRP